MKPFAMLTAPLLGLLVVTQAEAAPLYYNLTNLGSYKLQTDSNGYTHGVTDSWGTTYVFDKSPVTQTHGPEIETYHYGTRMDITFQTVNGSFKSGVSGEAISSGTANFFTTDQGWITMRYRGPLDVNIHGQMVGTSDETAAITGLSGETLPTYYGRFTPSYYGPPPNLPAYSVPGDFNYMVPGPYAPGFRLISAFKIDDSGRILADGVIGYGADAHDGSTYLLTPASMGAPQIVPEPSTILLWGMAIVVGLRSMKAYQTRGPAPSTG